MTKPTRHTSSPRVEKALRFLDEVETMGLTSTEARNAELAHRAGMLAEFVANRGLDGATDPKTPQGDVAGFEALHERYKDHPLITPADPTEKGVPQWPTYPVPASLEVEGTFEQWSSTVKHELAIKYSTPERKYSPEDFEAITYTDAEGNVWDEVIYAGANGMDFGNEREDFDPARSYNAIMDGSAENTAKHTIRIGDEEYDDRQGSTDAAYTELVATMKRQGKILPDSQHNKVRSNGGDMWYTWTLLTGESRADGVRPRIARVDGDGSVDRYWTYPDSAGRGLRFRPAVRRKRQS